MNALAKDIWSLLRGNVEATRIVPARGISSWLIIFTSAAMTFLAILALAFSFSAQRLAQTWTDELASSLTVRISAPIAQMKRQTDAAMTVLNTTPGIVSAEVISAEAQTALLEPWLGSSIDLERFALPVLISVEETPAGPDREGLALRLSAEAPGAVLDDHGRWRRPMIGTATTIRNLGFFVLALIGFALIAFISMAVHAAVVSNARNISTLRLIGARDTFIVRAFVRRMTLRALTGALFGVGVSVAFLLLAGRTSAFATTLGFMNGEWIRAAAVVPATGVIAFIAARISAFVALGRLN